METLRIGTDGASLGNPGAAAWAWVDEHGHYGAGSWTKATKNVAELTAIREALAAHPDTPLLIESDSQYAINCITDWGPGWREDPGRAAGKKNVYLVFSILGLLDERTAPVEFVWVRGHDATNAHPLNTVADRLASEFARKRTDSERVSGTTEIDWQRRTAPARPAGGAGLPTWATQTQIGKKLGLSAIEVGHALVRAGLRNGKVPSDRALQEDLVQPRKTKSGAMFYAWRADAVLPLLAGEGAAA